MKNLRILFTLCLVIFISGFLVQLPIAQAAPATAGSITQYPLPNYPSQPFGIALGPDKNLWFAEVFTNSIGRITPQGVITEFPLPTANSMPYTIVSGPDGNLWFTEWRGHNIGRITPEGIITEFPIPTPAA